MEEVEEKEEEEEERDGGGGGDSVRSRGSFRTSACGVSRVASRRPTTTAARYSSPVTHIRDGARRCGTPVRLSESDCGNEHLEIAPETSARENQERRRRLRPGLDRERPRSRRNSSSARDDARRENGREKSERARERGRKRAREGASSIAYTCACVRARVYVRVHLCAVQVGAVAKLPSGSGPA